MATGAFRDVSAETGMNVRLYGTGVAVGDYDNDGFVDVFLSCRRAATACCATSTGSFTDVTESMGVGGRYRTNGVRSCAWFDYDNDGDLDLFVCNYIHWSREIDLQQGFQLTGIGRAYGPPISFEGAQPYLYRNDGDRFHGRVRRKRRPAVQPGHRSPAGQNLGRSHRSTWIEMAGSMSSWRTIPFATCCT